MVARPSGVMEWPQPDKVYPRRDHHVGLLQERLGSSLLGEQDPRAVVNRGEQTTYKCVGAQSGNVWNQSFSEGRVRSTCPPPNGQQGSSSQYKQDGGDTVSRHVRDNEGNVEFLLRTADHNYCRISAGHPKHGSGHAISSVRGYQQLATGAGNISEITPNMGTPVSRSICGQTKSPTTTLRELEAGPGGDGNGCFLRAVAKPSGIRVPAIQPDQQVSSEISENRSNNSDSNANLARSTVVPVVVTIDSRLSNLDTQNQTVTSGTNQQHSSISSDKQFATSGMENIRRRRETAGFSNQALDILDKTRRPGTTAAYDAAWRQWTRWCEQEQLDPVQTSVVHIINFLSSLFEKGRQYATINTYRSMLSAYHSEIEGHKVGQHPTVREFMLGVFNGRPPKPRYSETWDVGVMLRHIEGMGVNGNLTDAQIAQKLTVLMTLTSLGRTQELQSINPQLIENYGDRVVIKIAALTKTKRPSKPHFSMTFQRYETENLDILDCLENYIQRTKDWRTNQERKNRLFLAVVQPHNPVVPSTIGRWIRMLMEAAGIDTEKFKAHSARGAAASKAAQIGISVEQILTRANWSNAQTFHRFYNKEICSQDNFQERIFNSDN